MASSPASRAVPTALRIGETMYEIAFSLEGVTEVSRRFAARAERVGDLTPAWPEVDKVFHLLVQQQFASAGAQGGERWPELARRTQLERAREGYGPKRPILVRTGDLQRSLTTLNGDAISVHHPTYYARGTGVEYFRYHQSRKPRKVIPRRAAIELSAKAKDALLRPIRIYLRGGTPDMTVRQQGDLQSSFLQGPGA